MLETNAPIMQTISWLEITHVAFYLGHIRR